MAQAERYRFARNTSLMCANLGVDPVRVLRRAGLSPDLLQNEGRGLLLPEYFRVWDAMMAEAHTPEAAVNLSLALAHGHFSSRIFAFSRAPSVAAGIERLGMYFPILWPTYLIADRVSDGLQIDIRSKDPRHPIPGTMRAFVLFFLVGLVRRYTSEELVPQRAGLATYAGDVQRVEAILRCRLHDTDDFLLEFSGWDADRPLIAVASETSEIWEGFPPNLRPAPDAEARLLPIGERVRSALLELLPGGQSGVGAVSERMNMSKRTLQRHLSANGLQFQEILTETRKDLALHYLRDRGLLVEEVALLLAFNDANAFYRAFRGWTGMTPAAARRPVTQTV
ncbi:helix-turn-helix domain-containing protein [Fluviibacterium sp. S390]|uniref:helix-turn-helix domain-containing protein n=1 Tax=Fluviibacterium sp. S390 TaxID=3415139 RepID=UPI003C79E7B1